MRRTVLSTVICSMGDRCCSCGACVASCSFGCIRMEVDCLGLLKPVVDEDKCRSCGACERACPAMTDGERDKVLSVFWAKARDEALRRSSSSGGIFGLLAQQVLQGQGGIVIGAAYDAATRSVKHIAVTSMVELERLRSSKYVQSELGPSIYKTIRDCVSKGRQVLFSGTSCQVAAVKRFMGDLGDSDKLICIDVVCHGSPVPLAWSRWIAHLEKRRGSKLIGVNFRDKRTGWSSYSVTYSFDDGSTWSHLASEDWYMKAFLNNASLSPRCFSCYSKGTCGSDITLGDYWGLRKAHPKIASKNGVSCVIVHTELGLNALSSLHGEAEMGESTLENALASNSSICKASEPYVEYGEFTTLLQAEDTFDCLLEKYPFKRSLFRRTLSHLASLVGR